MTKLEIRKTRIRLTLIYFVVFFVLLNIYVLISSAVNINNLEDVLPRGEATPTRIIDLQPGLVLDRAQRAAIRQLIDQGRQRLLISTLILQVTLVAASAGVSYVLAGLTLKPLIKAHQAQSDFIIRASHELKTPLTILRLLTESQKPNTKLNKEDKESSLEEIARLEALTNSLLSNIQLTSQTDRTVEKIQLNELVMKSLDRYKDLAATKQIILSAENLSKEQVEFNKAELNEILSVLLDNAVKYSKSNTQISIGTSREQGGISLSITNEVESEVQNANELFESFKRGNDSNQVPGFGLGLHIAKTLAEKNNAQLSFISRAKIVSLKLTFAA